MAATDGDAGDRAPPPAARGLHRARAARGAHHRGRARGGARREPAGPLHRAAARGGLPGLDLHRRRPPADRGGAPHRRAGDRAAHRRLLRGGPRRRRAARARRELARLREMARFAHGLGLEVHAGHGLTFDNVGPVAALPEVRELNIGHFLVGEAIFVGLEAAIRRMRAAMDAARGLRSTRRSRAALLRPGRVREGGSGRSLTPGRAAPQALEALGFAAGLRLAAPSRSSRPWARRPRRPSRRGAWRRFAGGARRRAPRSPGSSGPPPGRRGGPRSPRSLWARSRMRSSSSADHRFSGKSACAARGRAGPCNAENRRRIAIAGCGSGSFSGAALDKRRPRAIALPFRRQGGHGHHHRHRLRPRQHRADRRGRSSGSAPASSTGSIPRPSRRWPSGGASGSPPTPSAGRRRRPAPRRSAPGSAWGSSGATWGSSTSGPASRPWC